MLIWIVSGLLSLAMLGAGVMKAVQPKAKLHEQMPWVEDFSDQQIKGIGVLEILGAIGVMSPLLISSLTWLAGLAAAGLSLTMIGAAYTHFRRGEMSNVVPPVVLLLLALFVTFSRF